MKKKKIEEEEEDRSSLKVNKEWIHFDFMARILWLFSSYKCILHAAECWQIVIIYYSYLLFWFIKNNELF